jgi:hypothetical protein
MNPYLTDRVIPNFHLIHSQEEENHVYQKDRFDPFRGFRDCQYVGGM